MLNIVHNLLKKTQDTRAIIEFMKKLLVGFYYHRLIVPSISLKVLGLRASETWSTTWQPWLFLLLFSVGVAAVLIGSFCRLLSEAKGKLNYLNNLCGGGQLARTAFAHSGNDNGYINWECRTAPCFVRIVGVSAPPRVLKERNVW